MSSTAIKDPYVYNFVNIHTKHIQENFRYLQSITNSKVAAVVKADSYGIGANIVVDILVKEGCNDFFVAHLDEAISLRLQFPDIQIYTLLGSIPGSEEEFLRYNIIPVINSLSQLKRWNDIGKLKNIKIKSILQFDTGMNRNGLDYKEQEILFNDHGLLQYLDIEYYISHLASSDQIENTANMVQLDKFNYILSRLPKAKACFANSGGIFMGPEYHFDMVRPGIAIYGYIDNNRLQPAISIYARILEIHDAKLGDYVGYNQTHILTKDAKLATIAIGYADGISRAISNSGVVYYNNVSLPILGRVSMDSVVIDVSEVQDCISEGDFVSIFETKSQMFALAKNSNTIPYEIITSIGSRYKRYAV